MKFSGFTSVLLLVMVAHKITTWIIEQVLSFSLDIFAAIQVVHDAGIVHNDIKSQNYLVDTDE